VIAGVAAGAGGRAVGIYSEPHFGFGAEDRGAGDEVPGFGGEDVESEQVEVVGAIALFSGTAVPEAAEVSAAFAGGEALDLDAEESAAVFDADVVGGAVSPGLGDAEAVQGGLRHEFEFDPFATLLERVKTLPTLHLPHPRLGPKEKARL